MAEAEPPTSDGPDRRRGLDRETEAIPRARAESSVDPSADTEENDRYVGAASPDPYYPVPDPPPSFAEDEFGGLRDDPGPVFTPRGGRVLPLEEQPSKLIARYLFPTEKFRGEWRRHWVQLSKELVIVAVATILMGYLTGLAAKHNLPELVTAVILVWGLVMVYVAWRIADWYVDRFIL